MKINKEQPIGASDSNKSHIRNHDKKSSALVMATSPKSSNKKKKGNKGRESGTSSEEERWLDAIESGKLEEVIQNACFMCCYKHKINDFILTLYYISYVCITLYKFNNVKMCLQLHSNKDIYIYKRPLFKVLGSKLNIFFMYACTYV